jgi:hypothetical protein
VLGLQVCITTPSFNYIFSVKNIPNDFLAGEGLGWLSSLSTTTLPAPFALVIFEIGLTLCPGRPAGMTGMCHHAWLLLVEWGLLNFLPGLA